MICDFCCKNLNQETDEVWYVYAKGDFHFCKDCKKDYEEKIDPTGRCQHEKIGPITRRNSYDKYRKAC